MRHHRTGSIQAAVRDAYSAFGGLEAIREATGISMPTLSYGTEMSDSRPGGLGVNYLDTICRMEPACAVALAQHFASLAGGVFQPVDSSAEDACLVAGTQRMGLESGQAMSAAVGAIGSNCPHAVDNAKQELDDAVAAMLALKAQFKAKRSKMK